MINREATIRWKGYDPNELSPGSSKRIWAVCDECGKSRWITKQNYRDLCNKCGAKKRWSNKVERDKQSKRTTEYFENNPEAYDDRDEKQRGGNDICNHHYIYDHSDLSLNTVQITRSDHTSLHNLLRKLKYIVPHINKEL